MHQDIAANATWAPGTEGYQAPEILEDLPCSTKTDAYSVGATIAIIMEAFGRDQQDDDESNQILNMLQEISRNHISKRYSQQLIKQINMLTQVLLTFDLFH